MATGARCCVRCLVTRGPHAGASVVVCRAEASTVTAAETRALLLAIGRKKVCRLRLLRDLEVSSAHAEVRLGSALEKKQEGEGEEEEKEEEDAVVVRDIGSTNGSKLNGQPLTPLADYALKDGDLIGVGRSSVRVRFVAHLSTEDEAVDLGTKAVVSGQDVAVAVGGDVDKENAVEEPANSKSSQSAVQGGEGETRAELARDNALEMHGDAVQASDDRRVQTDGGGRRAMPQNARLDDHDDANAFESPKGNNRRADNAAAVVASSRRVSCMVCGQWLGLLDVMEQQLHINACLDGRTAPETGSSTAQSGRIARPPKESKKRKRRGAADPEQEQLTLAMALSKSLVGEGQQVNMQLALVRQELGQIDAQMAKLAKKRASLIKSMTRLEKKATKLRKSRVRPPGEVRALLRLEVALDTMFPSNRKAIDSGVEPQRKTIAKRRRWIYELVQDEDSAAPFQRLSCLSQPEREESADDKTSEDRVSMWARASQRPSFDQRERQMYYNSVLLAFLPPETGTLEPSREHKVSDEARQGVQDGAEAVESEPIAEQWIPAPESEAPNTEEDVVPDVVKHAFPNWRQDLEFLRERSVEELREALDELVCARDDGHLALLTQSQVPTDGHEQLLQDHEREEACAYMETVMRRLLDQKMHTSDEMIRPVDEGDREPPIVDLVDDKDEAETEEAVRSDARYRGSDIPDAITISDSDDVEVEGGMEVKEGVDVGGQFSTRVAGGYGDDTSLVFRSLSSSASSSASSEDDEVEPNPGCANVMVGTPTQAASDAIAGDDAWTQEVATQVVVDALHDARSTSPIASSSPPAGTSSGDISTSSDDDNMPQASDSSSVPNAAGSTSDDKRGEVNVVDTRILEALHSHEG